jgi:hypothetical protein
MLRWAWCSFHKMRTQTRYDELVFLYLVGYAGHILHSRVFWAAKCRRTIFHASVELVRIPQKACR